MRVLATLISYTPYIKMFYYTPLVSAIEIQMTDVFQNRVIESNPEKKIMNV